MKTGAKCTYDPKLHLPLILDAIPKVLALNQIANLCEIPPSTFKDWLQRGMNDRVNLLCTEVAQLSAAVQKARAIQIIDLLDDIRKRRKNWQASQWILERLFREDFGADAGVINELLAKQDKLEQILERYLDGAVNASA